MKNKRNSVEYSEKTWINKKKPINENSNVEGSSKNLANQVKSEPMPVTKAVTEQSNTSVIIMISKRTHASKRSRELLTDAKLLESKRTRTQVMIMKMTEKKVSLFQKGKLDQANVEVEK